MDSDTLHILLVEDDEVDVEAFQRAKSRSELTINLRVAYDGIQALEILRGKSGDPMPLASVVVLDLNLPRMNGLEFLAELREDEKLKKQAVFVLSTSSAEREIEAAQELGVAGFMVKSGRVSDLLGLITKIGRLQAKS